MTAPTASKGQLVWLDMDQKALDDAYDQIVYAPNRDQLMTRYKFNSDWVRSRIGEPQRMAYGSTAIEQLDLFAARQPHAPINVFIHGGAWRQLRASDYAFLAEMFVRAGSHFIALDFIGVENAKGSLIPMAEQVRRAIAWVYRNAEKFGGDPNRLFITGHSSGAHLGGCAVTADWKEHDVPDTIVKGALLCSGIYDLKPVRLSKRSEYIAFNDAIEESLSPRRAINRLRCPVIVAYGDRETPEFQRQSIDFADAIAAMGKPVSLLVGKSYNHFEMTEMIGNPLSLLGAAVLEQMGL